MHRFGGAVTSDAGAGVQETAVDMLQRVIERGNVHLRLRWRMHAPTCPLLGQEVPRIFGIGEEVGKPAGERIGDLRRPLHQHEHIVAQHLQEKPVAALPANAPQRAPEGLPLLAR